MGKPAQVLKEEFNQFIMKHKQINCEASDCYLIQLSEDDCYSPC